jgi:hypothetical protein
MQIASFRAPSVDRGCTVAWKRHICGMSEGLKQLNVASAGASLDAPPIRLREAPEGTLARLPPSAALDPAGQAELSARDAARAHQEALHRLPAEVGGAQGPEPTRFGDWEKNGRCTDF